ncbi:MAG: Tat pathway signal protein, partial [Halobacteriales archaeon]|nr:Tat pathway signal protein [Halobacteriales archaeon]
MSPSGGQLSRRAFVKSAVAIGGASALAACTEREGAPEVPTGPADLNDLPNRQHGWNAGLETDDAGNHLNARHHVVLLLEYTGSGPPAQADRETLESALQGLEHAYKRASDGLLLQIGYTPTYFDRFQESLPASVDLREPTALSALEDPDFDHPDALLHLASDYGSVVLAAEEVLFGETDRVNGVEMDASLAGIVERVDRRTGFVGTGLPADHQDIAGIPDGNPVDEEAPLYMGFKSGFAKAQASEDR